MSSTAIYDSFSWNASLNLFALSVCHQRHGELKLLHFFKNDHDKSSHQLSLKFQRHRCSPELDECQMGRRRRCGRFVFGICAVSQESYPLGIKAVAFISVGCRSSVESCHSRHTEHPPLVTNELRMCFEYRVSQNYPNMYFSTIISTALKPLKMWIPKFSEILIKRQS